MNTSAEMQQPTDAYSYSLLHTSNNFHASYFCYTGIPATPSAVSFSSVKSTTAVISWTITTNTINRPVDHIIIHYHITNSDDVLMVNVSADITSVTLEGLVPITLYTVNVAASNLAGNSSFSNDQGFLTLRGGEVNTQL